MHEAFADDVIGLATPPLIVFPDDPVPVVGCSLQRLVHVAMAELRNREDWEAVLDSVDTVLFDCDGMIWEL